MINLDIREGCRSSNEKFLQLSKGTLDVSALEKPTANERNQLGKLLDEDKKLLLIETGCQNISEMLKAEIDHLQKELNQRQESLKKLKESNSEDAEQINKLNQKIVAVEDQIAKIELETVGFHTQTAKLAQRLEKQDKELVELTVQFQKKKTQFEEKVVEESVNQQKLVDMKTSLREEQEKLEAVVKRNQAMLDELLQTYRNKLILEESAGDEELKQQVLRDTN